MKETYAAYAAREKENYIKLLKKLISIPAPSYREQEIGEVILAFLQEEAQKNNYTEVRIYMDDIYNVYCETGRSFDREGACRAVTAHTDTVFPECNGRLPVRENAGRIYGLGAKDNRANVCALLFCAKYLFENHIVPEEALLFVFNGCEEGLGNLRGSLRIMQAYPGIREWIAFDLDYTAVFHRAVGSRRYEVKVSAEGGHAFHDFGKKNAIVVMSELIRRFYEMDVRKFDGRTTYNVGYIEGGTSVNTIAQECTALFEWRSDSGKTLGQMEERFSAMLAEEQEKHIGEVSVERKAIGIRPSMGEFTEENKIRCAQLTDRITGIITAVTGKEPARLSGSTDCNVPFSRGIPAVCLGTCLGGGEHTRQEYVLADSLEKGLIIALEAALEGKDEDSADSH